MAVKKLARGINKTNFPQYLQRFLQAKAMACLLYTSDAADD